MKRIALLLTLVLAACNADRTPLSLKVVRSEMTRCPEASWLDGQEGNLKWNYTTGLELKAFLDVYELYGGDEISLTFTNCMAGMKSCSMSTAGTMPSSIRPEPSTSRRNPTSLPTTSVRDVPCCGFTI